MTTSLQTIPLTLLHDDPRSANVMSAERFHKLRANIERSGHSPPLIVRPHPEQDGAYMLIDGHIRKRVLADIGLEEAPCLVWALDDDESGLLLATLNTLRGEDHPYKRAQLIEGLMPSFGKDYLAMLLPENEAQIDDLLTLLAQDDTDIREVIQRHQEAEKAMLPTMLTFVLSQIEAERVNAVLAMLDANNPNAALVQLCEAYGNGQSG